MHKLIQSYKHMSFAASSSARRGGRILFLCLLAVVSGALFAVPGAASPDQTQFASFSADDGYLYYMEDTEGVTQLQSVTILAARNKQPHPTYTTEKGNLDTFWFLFSNGDFKQYVVMDQEVRLFSQGTYSYSLDDDPVINIIRTQKYMEGVGLRDYRSVHAYTIDPDEYLQFDGETLAGLARELPQTARADMSVNENK